MTLNWLKRSMPRGLYGRAALILLLPVVVVQLIVSIIFIQRHFEDVTQQMTRGIVLEVRLLADNWDGDEPGHAVSLARALRIDIATETGEVPPADRRWMYDLSGRIVISTLNAGLPDLMAVDLVESSRQVQLWLDRPGGPLHISVSRRRVSASNPHQLLVVMAAIGVIATTVAFIYLRNQLRPITRLAVAAEAFGRGRIVPYKPSGAVEVRAAGHSFLDMRRRIERQIEQRTLMLSGISHDLRTPLTRLKLALDMAPEGDETEAMQADLREMEGLIDAFLDFARGSAREEPEPVNPAVLASRVVEKAVRGGGDVTLDAMGVDAEALVVLRPLAVERALGNLVGNAMRYAGRANVCVQMNRENVVFVVEDNGPGIPKTRRAEAREPFTRLDGARNQDRGSGVGLGLSITEDVAKDHNGALRLADSKALGGLRAELRIARKLSVDTVQTSLGVSASRAVPER